MADAVLALLAYADALARPGGFSRARRAFYRTLIEIGGNRELARIFPAVGMHIIFSQYGSAALRELRVADYRHILDAVEREGTMSLKELRRAMPEGGRGAAFDRAVLGLEERGRVILSRDVDASHFDPLEQAEYVREGEILFTSIAKGN